MLIKAIVEQSSATFGPFGLFGLNALGGGASRFGGSSGFGLGSGGGVGFGSGFGLSPPSRRLDRSPESTPTEPWPSAVRIIDSMDLPTLLFSHFNVTNQQPNSGSLWSNIFNIFSNSPDDSINDEMERNNVAWFAIPGYNQLLSNGTELAHSILPGILVPAKVTIDQFQNSLPFLNPINNLTNTFPLNLIFNPASTIDPTNPFNLPINQPITPSTPLDSQQQNSSQMETLKMAQPLD